jgi:hypothetical protein
MQVKRDLLQNVTYQIHAGNSSIWSTPWIPSWDSIHLHLLQPVNISPLPETVSDLWLPHSQDWNYNLLNNIFDTQVTNQITNLRPVPNQSRDMLRWIPAKQGNCTTKNIYTHLAAQNIVQLPDQGTRSITPQTK